MKGSEIIIKALLEEKVEAVFGYPGGSVIPLFDKLYDYPQLNFYLVRHEQAAAHAADGYARATGKVGVCIATSGPGATNLTTGIATAYMDSIPMVAITGQVKSSLIGNDAFQEADVTGITRSISKHNYLVKNVRDLAPTIKEAFYLAQSGRPGPVVIDVPVDMQLQEADFDYSGEVGLRSYKPTVDGHPGQIKRALKLIRESVRPVIMIGGGVIISGADSEVTAFAEAIKAPVTATLMGLGGFPENHPLYLGMPGMHGTAYANLAITDSDLLITIGNRFDDRVTGKTDEFAPRAKIIHIDIDPTSISKNIKVDVPIVGDARRVLTDMLAVLTDADKPDTADWLATVDGWKKKHPLAYEQKPDGYIKPQYVIRTLDELTGGEAIVVTEVGQNQMWAAQFYTFTRPRRFLSSGGLGTMGYGFPAAMGAAAVVKDRPVVCIAGDGSIQMNIQELATVASYNIPVKIVILNNHYLGMVRQWQELFYQRRYSGTPLKNPDFVKVSDGYGVAAARVKEPSAVKDALRTMLDHNGPYLLEVDIEPEENVFPMVPAGEAINRMIGGMS